LFIVRSEISNSLTVDVDDLGIELYNYIVYGGLCLIAAIFSDNFFDSIADKILKKVENAEQMAVESNEKADALIEIKAEPENNKESGIQISNRKDMIRLHWK